MSKNIDQENDFDTLPMIAQSVVSVNSKLRCL